MKLWLVTSIFLASILLSQAISTPESREYEAGVVEFFPSVSEDSENDTMTNLEEYIKILEQPAAKNLDIILFPETALNSIDTAIYVPEGQDQINPCDSNNYTSKEILKELSCAAKNGNKYVVINLTEKTDCPDKEMETNKDERECRENKLSYYNTNVIFDRKGTVIATYRKFHLFKEEVNHPKVPQLVTFNTDFGVTFGTFVCFDINFADTTIELLREKKVTDIVFPSFWFSELPHATGN